MDIDVNSLLVSTQNIRKDINSSIGDNESSIDELSKSIEKHGLINPISVRKIGEKYDKHCIEHPVDRARHTEPCLHLSENIHGDKGCDCAGHKHDRLRENDGNNTRGVDTERDVG